MLLFENIRCYRPRVIAPVIVVIFMVITFLV